VEAAGATGGTRGGYRLPRLTIMPAPPHHWTRVWRYLLAAVIGAAAWTASAAVLLLSAPLTRAQQDAVGAMLFLDAVLGVAALGLLALRGRHPLAVAAVTTALSAVSVASMGPAALAVVSMAGRRRRDWAAVVAVVALIAGLVSEILYRPRFVPDAGGWSTVAGSVLLGLLLFAAALAVGHYLGTRRELVASLHERVLTAQREQALATQVAREAERNRIAREMHDVMAHRISLVALHAGALAYREDLSRAQTAEAAETIQANAQRALAELREVLGVLRAGPAPARVELPQPTLAELAALLADAREAGSPVGLDTSGLPGGSGHGLPELPEALSRTSFRIVQEALTNARKHAPGQPVSVRLAGAPGTDLEVEVRNPVGGRPGPDARPAGLGLAGLTERAELAGGELAYGQRAGGCFVVRARLPWPA
jgi:signal transduction histidine kinase